MEASDFCVEPIFFDIARIVCRKRIDMVFICPEHTLECFFSHVLRLILQKHTVHAVAHIDFVAGAVVNGFELHVGVVANVFGQLGDLSTSLIKREAGIKDYSHIFLTHGGVLDRFDSILFIAPVVYAAVMWMEAVL